MTEENPSEHDYLLIELMSISYIYTERQLDGDTPIHFSVFENDKK